MCSLTAAALNSSSITSLSFPEVEYPYSQILFRWPLEYWWRHTMVPRRRVRLCWWFDADTGTEPSRRSKKIISKLLKRARTKQKRLVIRPVHCLGLRGIFCTCTSFWTSSPATLLQLNQ